MLLEGQQPHSPLGCSHSRPSLGMCCVGFECRLLVVSAAVPRASASASRALLVPRAHDHCRNACPSLRHMSSPPRLPLARSGTEDALSVCVCACLVERFRPWCSVRVPSEARYVSVAEVCLLLGRMCDIARCRWPTHVRDFKACRLRSSPCSSPTY